MLKAHSLDSAKNQSVDQLFTLPLLILLLLIPPHQCTHLISSDSELISSVALELQVLNYTQAFKPEEHQLLSNNTTKCLCNKLNNNHKLKPHSSDLYSEERLLLSMSQLSDQDQAHTPQLKNQLCIHLKNLDSELKLSVVSELLVLNCTKTSKLEELQLLSNNTIKCSCNKLNNNHKLKDF